MSNAAGDIGAWSVGRQAGFHTSQQADRAVPSHPSPLPWGEGESPGLGEAEVRRPGAAGVCGASADPLEPWARVSLPPAVGANLGVAVVRQSIWEEKPSQIGKVFIPAIRVTTVIKVNLQSQVPAPRVISGESWAAFPLASLGEAHVQGKPHPVLQGFAQHLRQQVLIPSGRGGGRGGARIATAPGGCFTYEPPPGVVWEMRSAECGACHSSNRICAPIEGEVKNIFGACNWSA